jgi:NitT/TauT family transport system ATP-binding protein
VQQNTAVIFQDYGLLLWKTVFANAELPLLIAKIPAKERRQRVNVLLEEFGLMELRKRYPRQLSGGERQRLAIVRALVSVPRLLLMDEPFSSLDALSREDAQELLLTLHSKHPLTIIIVTHSVEEAVYLADSILVINRKNPGASVDCIDNRHSRESDFRKSPQFHHQCGRLRDMLKSPQSLFSS